MNRFVSSIRSLLDTAFPTKQKPLPTIDSYGQALCGLPEEEVQSIVEWLFMNLISVGYSDNSHLIWYDNVNPDPDLEQAVLEAIRQREPLFLYRIEGKTLPPPEGYYWRMMLEHPSTRFYQLDVKVDD